MQVTSVKRIGLLFAFALALAVPPPAAAQDTAAITQAVRAERPKYPARGISRAQIGQMLNDAAAKVPGWGLLAKPDGANCAQPGTGVLVSCDWLVHLQSKRGCDILSSATDDPQDNALATPTGCSLEPVDISRFVAAVASGGGGGGTGGGGGGGGTTPEPSVDLGPVLLKIVKLLEEIKAGQDAQTAALKAAIVELQAQVKAGVKIRF